LRENFSLPKVPRERGKREVKKKKNEKEMMPFKVLQKRY